jgi:putative membrane-bound dehydrogenase-like protein
MVNFPSSQKPALRQCFIFAALLVALLAARSTVAAEQVAEAKDFPRFKPVEPAAAVSSMRVKKGFRVELVAAEPQVVNPVAMAFDENGRLYVVEMRDPEHRDASGTIRLLESTHQDGRYDKSTLFAKDLTWPTTVICYNGGVFVAAPPDILWLKDTHGNGVADERKVVFTGFSTGGPKGEFAERCVNGFKWGLDHRIYGASSYNGGQVRAARAEERDALNLRGRDFSFDPRTLNIRAETGTAQWGLTFDNRERKFVCSNTHHIQTLMYADRYAGRNPLFAMPNALVDIPADGPAAEIFRISPDEPWRVFRQRWRAEAGAAGAEGGRASGSFTSACGITVYTGNAFPAEYVGNAFVADPANNIVHRKTIREAGVELIAERSPEEQKVEFMASTDTWFRPVNFANAPDGALYVADIYREIIEGSAFIPESIRKFLDFDSGNDRGRIFRVVPEDFHEPKTPQLKLATTAELVTLLEHPNGWHRETASRLLFERQDKTAVSLLEHLLQTSASAQGRLHALYALDGQSALAHDDLVRGLADADATVREHAVRLAENFLRQNPAADDPLSSRLPALAGDPSALVRYQLAFTLGEMPGTRRAAAFAEILRHDASSAWTQAAILSSLANGRGDVFAAVSADSTLTSSPGGQEFLRQLAGLIGAANQSEEVAGVFAFLTSSAAPSLPVMRGLGEGLRKAGSSLAAVDKEHRLQGAFDRARVTAKDVKAGEEERVQSIELLSLTSFQESGALLASLIGPDQPQTVQMAAVETLARFSGGAVATTLLKSWEGLTPRLRSAVLTALLARPERALELLAAIQSGTVKTADLNASQIQFLQKHGDKKVHELAATVLAAPPARPREEVVATFRAAMTIQGDAPRGQAIYLQRCISCHRAANQGSAVGPDLVTVKSTGREKLLDSIIDPSREVDPKYVAYLVETKTGESLLGVIASESPTSIIVRQPFGKEETVLRSNLKRMQNLNQSLMPEGLEAGLTPAQMADLLQFIESLQ